MYSFERHIYNVCISNVFLEIINQFNIQGLQQSKNEKSVMLCYFS